MTKKVQPAGLRGPGAQAAAAEPAGRRSRPRSRRRCPGPESATRAQLRSRRDGAAADPQLGPPMRRGTAPDGVIAAGGAPGDQDMGGAQVADINVELLRPGHARRPAAAPPRTAGSPCPVDAHHAHLAVAVMQVYGHRLAGIRAADFGCRPSSGPPQVRRQFGTVGAVERRHAVRLVIERRPGYGVAPRLANPYLTARSSNSRRPPAHAEAVERQHSFRKARPILSRRSIRARAIQSAARGSLYSPVATSARIARR